MKIDHEKIIIHVYEEGLFHLLMGLGILVTLSLLGMSILAVAAGIIIGGSILRYYSCRISKTDWVISKKQYIWSIVGTVIASLVVAIT